MNKVQAISIALWYGTWIFYWYTTCHLEIDDQRFDQIHLPMLKNRFYSIGWKMAWTIYAHHQMQCSGTRANWHLKNKVKMVLRIPYKLWSKIGMIFNLKSSFETFCTTNSRIGKSNLFYNLKHCVNKSSSSSSIPRSFPCFHPIKFQFVRDFINHIEFSSPKKV